MPMDDLARILASHPFLAELPPDQVRFLVGCTRNLRFRPGEYLVREGQAEDTLFLLRQGTVAIEAPRAGEPVCIETLGAGDVIGVSLVTRAPAHLDCRARDTVIALAIEHACLHRKMDEDPRLGYAIAMRLLERTYDRLARARLQHLDVYK
jgi:CRP/FNR family transcriptional regulator, cyclic AMP receptor protein